jgi:2-polyprenyl-3-methyl-5-hydroxy-6-metoxy-1,4-benzoquinol methylase
MTKNRISNYCVCCGSPQLKKSPAILMPFVAERVFGWQPVEITKDWGLNTIQPGMAYSVCNSVQCEMCQFLFLDIRFDDSEMNNLYHGYRETTYVEMREKYETGYKERNATLNAGVSYLAEIEKFLMPYLNFPVSILDWGGDTGKNSPFKEQNKTLHIYDISDKPVIDGAKKVDKNTLTETVYDLIVCSNVLEHIPYPEEVILDIKNFMSKDSILYIEVPLENLIQEAKTLIDIHTKKKHWHEHINFYNEDALEKLLSRCGFSLLKLEKLKVTCLKKVSYHILIACQLAL